MHPDQRSLKALPTYFLMELTPKIHPVGCTTVAMAAMAVEVAETVEAEVVDNDNDNEGHDASMFV